MQETTPTPAPAPASGPSPEAGLLERLHVLRKHPVVDLLLTLVVAVMIAYGVQRWVVKPYRIPSQSMESTLHVGDRVLAVRFLYHVEDPHRGEIVIFHPNGQGDQAIDIPHVASVTFIKRLIGLPGDWVRGRQGHVQICKGPSGQACRTLIEPYVSSPQADFAAIHVPAGHYFMMGDNRANSDDSRDWGTIARSQIIGEAFAIYWPPDRIRFF